MNFDIDFLADHPHYVSIIAPWLHLQWGWQHGEKTVEDRITRMKKWLHRGKIPFMLVAHSDGKPMGTTCVVENDMDSRQDLTPWIATVYVAKEYRKSGVGSTLVKRGMQEAKKIGVKRLYLITPDQENFYKQIGWSTIEKAQDLGREVFLMSADLA